MAAQRELERQRAADALKKGLEKRPERDDLVDRTAGLHHLPCTRVMLTAASGNILPDSTAAPALQAQARELQKSMRKNSLEQKLQSRPKPEDLVKGGILPENENPIA